MSETRAWCLWDPHWGEGPFPIYSTIRETREEAIEAALTTREGLVAFYSGASEYPMPNGTRGRMDLLEEQGFRIAPCVITPDPD